MLADQLTPELWNAILTRMEQREASTITFGKVTKRDEARGIVWVEGISSDPIPVIGHQQEFYYYQGGVRQTGNTQPVIPHVGDDVLLARTPSGSLRCLGPDTAIGDAANTSLGMIALSSLEGSRVNWHEGSTPPASPQVNDLWLFHPATGISWTFRYEPDQDGTYPWQFVSGHPHGAQLANDESPTLNATWHDLPTVGPDITVARSGIYTIGCGFDTYDDGGGVGWSTVNGGPALGAGAAPGVSARASVNPTVLIGSSPFLRWTFTNGIAAGTLVRMRYLVTSGALANVQIRYRHMWVHPIRIA